MPDQEFEKAFSALAHTELEQKAPVLFPYLVGFQLVNKTDDEKNAVAVFGFKIGEQWYYCPVFWMNGMGFGGARLSLAWPGTPRKRRRP